MRYITKHKERIYKSSCKWIIANWGCQFLLFMYSIWQLFLFRPAVNVEIVPNMNKRLKGLFYLLAQTFFFSLTCRTRSVSSLPRHEGQKASKAKDFLQRHFDKRKIRLRAENQLTRKKTWEKGDWNGLEIWIFFDFNFIIFFFCSTNNWTNK